MIISHLSEIAKGNFSLNPDEAHHIANVLRMKNGEEVQITDNQGKVYRGKLSIASAKKVDVEIIQLINEQPSPFPINLNLAFLKSEKMEWVIEKAAELHIESITFFCAERSVRQDLKKNKWERFEKIAVAAQKQSGRAYPLKMEIAEYCDLINAQGSHLFAAERGEHRKSISQIFSKDLSKPYYIWIGPEGGWTDTEIDLAKNKNFNLINLGPLILRAETAAISALAALTNLSF